MPIPRLLCGKRLRFFSTFEFVNVVEQEKAQGKAGQIANRLSHIDLVILDELGYLPFSASGGALLFHLLNTLYEHQRRHRHHLSFSEWAMVFGDAKIMTRCSIGSPITATSLRPETTARFPQTIVCLTCH